MVSKSPKYKHIQNQSEWEQNEPVKKNNQFKELVIVLKYLDVKYLLSVSLYRQLAHLFKHLQDRIVTIMLIEIK